jgi:hypothetical protein
MAKRAPAPKVGRPSKGDAGATATLTVRVTHELHARLLRAVTERGESAGSIVRAALERELG